VDRDAIARAGRRREVLDALAFEREREAALREQIDAVVLEVEGPRIDRSAKALLGSAELDLVVDVFPAPPEYDEPSDEAADRAANEGEIERLREEIAGSQARQQALERLAALLESQLPEVSAAETAS
jgi:hypothetical protein